jgi:thioredoxin-like negative regulator of GroEL
MLAEELGPAVRILKLDSDKYPRLASLLKVQGLPTLVYFDGGNSSEVQRVEGALTKGQLVEFLNTVEFINKRVEEGR